MKIETFVGIVEGIVGTEDLFEKDYNFFCGLVADYNREKKISDTIILLPPKSWPLNWRANCWHDVEIEMMIGRLVNLRTENSDTYPYAIVRDKLNDDARVLLRNLNGHSNVQVVTSSIAGEYFSTSEGATVNSQEFLKLRFTVKLWNEPDESEYLIDDLTGLYIIDEE